MPTVLVTGGAGYIGSHTLRALTRAGYEAVVYDAFLKGHPAAVADYRVVVGELSDRERLERVFAEFPIQAVLHFAAFIEAGESVQDPGKYYRNNVCGTLSLLEAMVRAGVRQCVFSSSAAVYGDPEEVPIPETAPTRPTNPYGRTKLMVGQILDDFHQAYGLRSISLRYFNAAGASPDDDLGEDHHPETHLIPILLEVALGQRDHVDILGNDYPTPDGTCIRDYIHVCDLADAHVLALQALERGAEREVYNLGNGQGFSVLQVVETARAVTGHPVPAQVAPRRPGDPLWLVAAAEKARRELGWTPRFPDLRQIIASAWEWRRRHPRGFPSEPA
ncbi:MAG: UDP-glucose 4-epimerase GalE [Armatimonadetes bacterium]|nr:UDP-glucose 4-epimerase GalE [Armatimonadota bacterium]